MTGCWPVLRDAIRGYSQAEADKLSITERRRRTSGRVANGARVVYLSIQLVCIFILFQSDSALGTSWRAGDSYAGCFLGVVSANLMLYVFLCASDPGYLPIKEHDPESNPLIDFSQKLSTDKAVAGSPPVQVHSGGAASYQPLPYPTDYANYINPAVLSSNNHDTSPATTPWWDLPNPGRWCEHCHAWQELRAKHCHVCSRCVRRFDHHCAWTNNCVGQDNHARFWWYLTIQGMLITWALADALSAWSLHPEFQKGFMPGFSILVASTLLFLTFLFDWGLWAYHSFLLATGRTTAEHIYRRNGPVAYLQHVPRKVSAFSQGLMRNVYLACCTTEPVVYHLPPREQLLQSAQQETFWDNRYYSCCR